MKRMSLLKAGVGGPHIRNAPTSFCSSTASQTKLSLALRVPHGLVPRGIINGLAPRAYERMEVATTPQDA